MLYLAFLLLAHHSLADKSQYYTIYQQGDSYSVKQIKDVNGVAWCSFSNQMMTKGWSFIDIETNPSYSDQIQMYAAGYLEAFISTDLIWANYINIFTGEWDSKPFSSAFTNWMEENIAFMNTSQQGTTDTAYWTHVGLVWTQLMGMVDGYTAGNTNPAQVLELVHFLIINMDGDLEDLLPALNQTSVEWDDMDAVANYHLHNTHCSALVKVADDFSELYVGHSTWESYYEMTRMFKTYRFNLAAAQTASKVQMMSSYPGTVSSIDDFYQMDTGLVVTETTNGLMDDSLYGAVTPSSVLSFLRVVVANRMSSNGADWVQIFSMYNSGTYNNQWIVVDHNKLMPGVGLKKGALYILEQVPGYIESMDATSILQFGYWGSFNVPYFENIYNMSDFAPYAEKYGTVFSYMNNPRAEIFRRDANKVEHIGHMQKMMRYNDWENDKLSQGNAGNAISSRYDLCEKHIKNPYISRSAEGAIDSKVSSTSLWKNMTVLAQSGPTHDQQPPFSYTGEWAKQSHVGQPTLWNFDWVSVQAGAPSARKQ